MRVDRGEVVALIGGNGAGKTTLQRAVCGLEPVRDGRVVFEGNDLVGMRTHEIVKLGLIMVPLLNGGAPVLIVVVQPAPL